MVLPLAINPLPQLRLNLNESLNLNLLSYFDDPLTTGKVARFELYDSSLGGGISNVLLFDQVGEGAPLTVQNFINYVDSGSYVNSIIHRSIPGFVVQGGGFFIDTFTPINPNETFLFQNLVDPIVTNPPVVNEFSANRSNTIGTIAMAKLDENPDSATSQWFFNLGDNSSNLDFSNGGFTVFGEVISQQDFDPIIAIAETQRFTDRTTIFSSVPLLINQTDNQFVDSVDDFVRYESITVSQQQELSFSITGNNPNLLNITVVDGELNINPIAGKSGVANIEIKATSLLGETIEQNLNIIVGDPRWTLDIDGNGIISPAVDGTLIMRYLFGGFTGNTLIEGLVDPTQYRTLSEIEAYLAKGVTDRILDFDGDGVVRALSDGVMAVRSMFDGFEGDLLCSGASSANATRTCAAINTYLADLSVLI